MSNVTATGKEMHAGSRALLSAADEGDAALVASLIAKGSRADSRLPSGETPLMRASSRGFEDVARVLLDAGADVNTRRGDGFTPLVLAVFFGHESVVRLLLERGADTTVRTRLGTTPRHWADARGFKSIAALLPVVDAARPREITIRLKPERPPVEEVSIFSRKLGRNNARPAFESADAVEAEKIFSTLTARASASPASASTSTENVDASVGPAADMSTANVSMHRDERLPSHPSASSFRVGNFLRSWQASVGTALLLLAFVVGIYAVWHNVSMASQRQRPAAMPQSLAPQTVAQPNVPAQSLPSPQASPALPTSDAQSSATPGEMSGATYVVPIPAGQPYYNPTNPGQANAPKEPTVISESGGATVNSDASRPKSRTDSTARETPSSNTAGESRNDTSADDNSRTSGHSTRPTEAQPARPSTPSPSATPEHSKVIQWPPQ